MVTSKGFTLLELLVAMMILAIVFMGLANMQISCIRGNSDSLQLMNAVILAQTKMEELKGLPSLHPDLADTCPANNGNLGQAADPDVNDHSEDGVSVFHSASEVTYTCAWNVADDTPFPGTKTVVVIVKWGNHHKRVVVSSVI